MLSTYVLISKTLMDEELLLFVDAPALGLPPPDSPPVVAVGVVGVVAVVGVVLGIVVGGGGAAEVWTLPPPEVVPLLSMAAVVPSEVATDGAAEMK